MNIICKNCGTSSRYSKGEMHKITDGFIIRHTCACGRCKSSTFYAKTGDATWMDNELIDQNLYGSSVKDA